MQNPLVTCDMYCKKVQETMKENEVDPTTERVSSEQWKEDTEQLPLIHIQASKNWGLKMTFNLRTL